MSNVVDFILGYLFGIWTSDNNKRMYEDEIKNSKYVPKFTGYYRNEGTRYDEDRK